MNTSDNTNANQYTDDEVENDHVDTAQMISEFFDEVYGAPSEPRGTGFQAPNNGPIFAWTTARDHEDWFWSFVYYPVGPGARTGAANRWSRSNSSCRKHRRRKDAKARAAHMYER